MPVTCDYRSTSVVSLDDLRRIRTNADDHYIFRPEIDLKEGIHAFFNPKSLPSLAQLGHGGKIVDLTVKGLLSLKEDPFPSFEQVLGVATTHFLGIAATWVDVGFEEKESRQTRRAYDSFCIRCQEGKFSFLYGANGSKSHTDRGYRKQFMGRLIEVAQLPLILEDCNDHYRLRHQFGGDLWISHITFPDLSPSTFRCELPEASAAGSLDRLRRSLDAFASPKRFEYAWTVVPLHQLEEPLQFNERIVGMYQIVLNCRLPATSYSLDLTYTIEGCDAIEPLKALCGPKDKVFVPLCSYWISNTKKEHLNLEVEICARGYRLLVEASVPIDMNELSAHLGVEVVERRHG